MQFTVIENTYFDRDYILVKVEGEPLKSPWVTTIANVSKTIDKLNQDAAKIIKERGLNLTILEGMKKATEEVKLEEMPVEEQL